MTKNKNAGSLGTGLGKIAAYLPIKTQLAILERFKPVLLGDAEGMEVHDRLFKLLTELDAAGVKDIEEYRAMMAVAPEKKH